jgi:hypothetical protein
MVACAEQVTAGTTPSMEDTNPPLTNAERQGVFAPRFRCVRPTALIKQTG